MKLIKLSTLVPEYRSSNQNQNPPVPLGPVECFEEVQSFCFIPVLHPYNLNLRRRKAPFEGKTKSLYRTLADGQLIAICIHALLRQ